MMNHEKQREWEGPPYAPPHLARKGRGWGQQGSRQSTMIEYRYDEEKTVALFLADLLGDEPAKGIIQKGGVANADEATHLSKFFWAMVNKSADGGVELPCEGSTQYWTEKLYNSIGGYLERAGYEAQWNEEIDRA